MAESSKAILAKDIILVQFGNEMPIFVFNPDLIWEDVYGYFKDG